MKNQLEQARAFPTAEVAANVAGQLPQQLAASKAAQAADTAAVMDLTARLTGASSPKDAK